jgi:cytochrome c oxidase assembly factor CtaG
MLIAMAILTAVAIRGLMRRSRDHETDDVSFGSVVYWTLTAALLVFGVLAGLSIGVPFLFAGLALAVLAPYRKRAALPKSWRRQR